MTAKQLQLVACRNVVVNRMEETKNLAENADANPLSKSLFKARFSTVNSLYEEFQQLHVSILTNLSAQREPDFEAEDRIRKTFDNDYYYVLSRYEQLFEKTRPTRHEIERVAPNAASHSTVKLPKVNLPEFDGNLRMWPTYRDMFSSMIHNNASLSNIERFQYLISSLKKEPLTLAKTLPMTNDNYPVVYSSLLERYNNTRSLATFYWREIQNLPTLRDESAKNLRNLIDSFSENIQALKLIGLPTDQWDFILVTLLLDKLDNETRRQFELTSSSEEIPNLALLIKFLKNHCKSLDSLPSSKRLSSPLKGHSHVSTLVTQSVDSSQNCSVCSSDHSIYKCPILKKKSPFDRYQLAKQKGLCYNCLRSNHMTKNCSSSSSCKVCHSKHHTFLHFAPQSPQEPIPDTVGPSEVCSEADRRIDPPTNLFVSTSTPLQCSSNACSVILATVQLEVLDSQGHPHVVRALLDSGSQANILTERCFHRLKLRRNSIDVPLYVMGQDTSDLPSSIPRGQTTCIVRPIAQTDPSYRMDFVLVPQICGLMPNTRLNTSQWKHLVNIKFSDSSFDRPGKIDMLLGASIFPWILKCSRVFGKFSEPVAMETIFGWILMGNSSLYSHSSVNSFHLTLDNSLNKTMLKFWEIENLPDVAMLSPEDIECENIFKKTVYRNTYGRYVVSLPFKTEQNFVGSREIALRRLYSLERKLAQNPPISEAYTNFMQNYLDSGHMEIVQRPKNFDGYYIPHHCVVRPESTTTKLRVVFDASCRDANGVSLNDCLLVGPKLQKDIVILLSHFRLHKIVFTADIKQMYRQILVQPSHCDYQRIVWRSSPDQPVQDFRLKTVTYGVSSAPFLALRTINQLASDEAVNFPLAAEVLKSDIYVDDIVSGSPSIEVALATQQQLIELFAKGGFELRKWAANHPNLLKHLSEDQSQIPIPFDNDIAVKILGLQWIPATDSFSYSVCTFSSNCTKRSLLSDIARLFDPLGFLSPLIMVAKSIIQQLWSLGLDWDDKVPEAIERVWARFQSEMWLISHLTIPRNLNLNSLAFYELHLFCDASEKGYAAVAYLRIHCGSTVNVQLLMAKSKVAPLKTISIPRLELCGAFLLAKLVATLRQIYSDELTFTRIVAWTDSIVSLSWIKTVPHRLKTFVANRVSYIQEVLHPSSWNYVPSTDNPADCASRGLFASELVEHLLWWNGPKWLLLDSENWPSQEPAMTAQTEKYCQIENKQTTLCSLVSLESLDALLVRYSSLDKIERIIAYCYRFARNCQPSNKKLTAHFHQEELYMALMLLVKRVQAIFFEKEIHALRSKSLCPKPLRKLNPFLDERGVLRVGGRLSHADISYESMHPAILPRCSRLTELIIERTHIQNCHPGLKTLSHLLAQKFWILSSNRAIRSCLSQCIRCFRVKPSVSTPLMGDLPSPRVREVKPFNCSGVDFAGPFTITMSKTRGAKTTKAYLCLFVCFATKAVHLELASDLSSESFLAALRRFISRRGRCNYIYSDCGTNFRGAYTELCRLMQGASENEKLNWHFNPPSSPHMGGLWEAGVKAVKTHLIRVVGSQILTYEELYTVFTQIEAILNSRPLTPLSSDPNDLTPLTPGHFLTLEPLTAPPCSDLTNLNISRLDRWQLLVRLQQDFWSRWHTEYLHTLQQRHKWNKPGSPISIGSLVLIKNELTAPLRWPLARVMELHSGEDGVSRVATVKTQQGIFKRPIVKLCPLPLQ